MTLADDAIDNALHCEMVKCSYRQTRDGVVIGLVIHPQEVPKGLATAPLGTRYMVALVQIGDDERPIKQEKEKPNPTAAHSSPTPLPGLDKPPAGMKREWKDLQPQQQAGIRCGEPIFIAFLKEQYANDWRESQDAAGCIRLICEVNSRVELGTNKRARIIWHQIDAHYQAWLLKERVGA